MIRIFITTLLCFISMMSSYAQVMKGKILDVSTQKPLEYVIVQNIHTGELVQTGADGIFSIKAKKGELVEFHLLGYKEERIRLNGDPKSYYNIGMVLGPIELETFVVYDKSTARRVDSVRTAEVFRRAINHYRLEGSDAFYHPFSALSKENRRIWAFQERYAATEKYKYIEDVFNEKLIKELTKLGSDSMAIYRERFKPEYYQLMEWNEYEYYSYIKESVKTFRTNSKYYFLDTNK